MILKFEKFFESVINKENFLSEEDKNEITDIFSEFLDEGFIFVDKDKKEDKSYHAFPGEITFVLSNSILDKDGRDEYTSPFMNLNRFSKTYYYDKEEILKEHFKVYQTIIYNLNFSGYSSDIGKLIYDESKIEKICNDIYDRLISMGYRCQLWDPDYKEIRFHIATDYSHPFLYTKNYLKIDKSPGEGIILRK